MQNKQPIGIFDSGIGGLSVLSELKKLLPYEKFIYFADSANIPYGTKTAQELFCFSKNILDFFKKQNVKMVIVACNTSSAITLEALQKEYDFPIVGMIESTAKFLAQQNNIQKIGIIATLATVNSNSYKNCILKYSPDKQIFQTAALGLVEIVENNSAEDFASKKLITEYIDSLTKENVQKIVLGCTHYPFLQRQIEEIIKQDNLLINPAKYLSEDVFNILENNNLLCPKVFSEDIFYTSENPQEFTLKAKVFYPEITIANFLELNKTKKVVSS